MSAAPLTRPSVVAQLSAGVSRITVRYGHWRPRYRKPQPELTGYSEGHGEQIWLFDNVRSKQVVYSHSPVLDVRLSFCSLRVHTNPTLPFFPPLPPLLRPVLLSSVC
jgi:hypothetical protein